MTIAIASYQRREPLLRLLRSLDRELAASEDLRRGLQVVVVLDGSNDGSKEAVEAGTWSVPVRVRWQPNRGLAAARNRGLEAARGGLVWFLDDDLVPTPGLVARHRRAHTQGPPSIVVGPCLIPPEVRAPEALRKWWNAFYAELGTSGVIDRFDRFTTANASGPASLFMVAGGFDESFATYGLEDYELAVRLLRCETPLRFDAEAVAWHPDIPPMSVLVNRERSIGLNAARIARLHPETVDALFPLGKIPGPRRLLRRLGPRRAWSLMAVSRLAFGIFTVTSSLHAATARRAEHLSRAAAHAAGVAEGDPEGVLLDRLLGHSGGADGPGRDGSCRGPRSCTQALTSPTSNESTISR